MNDLFIMNVLKRHDNTSYDEFFIMESNTCLILGKILLIADMIAQISSSKVIHDKIEIFIILEGLRNVDEKIRTQIR